MIIYKVTNNVNGKMYIGKTISSLGRRITEHNKAAKKGITKSIFHYAIRKYGINMFTFEVICRCASLTELAVAEVQYIEKQNTRVPNGYNITMGGDGVGGYKHTEQSKEKMRKAASLRSNEYREKQSNTMKNHISKMRDSGNHRSGWHHSIRTKNILRDMKLGTKWTDEDKTKRSMKYTGDGNPFFGKRHTDETKELLRKKAINRGEEKRVSGWT